MNLLIKEVLINKDLLVKSPTIIFVKDVNKKALLRKRTR